MSVFYFYNLSMNFIMEFSMLFHQSEILDFKIFYLGGPKMLSNVGI